MNADSDPDSTPNINHSSGTDLNARRDITIGGDVTSRDKITSVNTGGGAHVEGNVQTTEFVGRDKTIIQTINNFFQGDAAQRDLRNRRNMLERVKNDWVKGVLEKSLYHEVMLDLGLEERPGEVQHPWDMTLHMPDRENHPLLPGTKIMQVFDEANHALLILGEPGSGKTTMLLELARNTIARAEQDPTQPIPVVFNLSSRSDSKQSIVDWLVQELRDKYDVHKKIAQPWIDNDDLLLLFDGLDELKAEHHEACVKAINDFRNESGQTQLVVCSRIANYETLTTKLELQGAVLLQPLTSQQINEYFKRAGDELEAVRETLKHDADLQELAQSPLMLGIMTLAYRGMPVEAVLSRPLDTTEAHSKHLFDAYTQQMFSRVARARNETYPREKTMHWLSWLAARMSEHRQTVFLLEGMQPSWLQSQGQRWTFSIVISVLILGLIGGLVGALIGGLLFGVLLGLVSGRASMRDSGWMKIKLAESIKWLWSGPVWGSSLGVGLGLVLVQVLSGGNDLVGALGAGLLMGALVALFVGLETAQIETKTRPNQGVCLSGRNAVFLMLLFWLFSELIIGLLDNDLVAGLKVGLLGGLLFSIMFGGIAFIQHLVLRSIMWLKGDIPLNYVRFLDYAADRIFLRKVGGGYIFIHRMLMEYFASLEMEPGAGSSE